MGILSVMVMALNALAAQSPGSPGSPGAPGVAGDRGGGEAGDESPPPLKETLFAPPNANPGARYAVVPVLRADRSEMIQELIADVGFYTPLGDGYRFEEIRIDTDRVTYVLKRGGETAGTLRLTPRTPASTLSSESFTLEIDTDDQAARTFLEAAARSVVAHDEGGLYTTARARVEGEPFTRNGDAGRALGELLSSDAEPTSTVGVQVRVAGLLFLVLVIGLARGLRRQGEALRVEWAVKQSHVIPIVVQLTVYAYWSLYWEGVAGHVSTLVLQIVFAVALDAALGFSQHRSWRLGVSPIPIVLSANLFVWFYGHDQWLGFVVVAFALLSKAFITRADRPIFNPSAFGVSMVGLACLTMPEWFGYQDIARELALPPNMVEVLLGVLLIAQFRVPVVLVSAGALVGLSCTGLVTGWELLSPYYPAVLIAITLLATDPATSPSTGLGRLAYGLFVGVSIHVVGIGLSIWVGMDFWAKVLPIPLANACVPLFDRFALWVPARWRAFLEPVHNRAHVAVWLVVMVVSFAFLDIKRGIFDPDAHHEHRTHHVMFQDDGFSTCEDNPAFCQPFSFATEIAMWWGEETER